MTRALGVLAFALAVAGCDTREEQAERRRLDAWLDVVERAGRGAVDEASPVPYYCADYLRKAASFRKLRGAGASADRFAAACAHDAPVAWLRDDLLRHAAGAPLCALDRLAIRGLPDEARRRERALVDEVERRCATAGSPARPSPDP